MKNELYKVIKNYCEENHCWGIYETAKEWNNLLNTAFAPGTFTSAVNAGLLVKSKMYREKSYSYALAPTKEMLAAREEEKRQGEIKMAQWFIEHYEERVAQCKEAYEYSIEEAKRLYEERMAQYDKDLAEAKALLGIE
jgi:hypothetical protein